MNDFEERLTRALKGAADRAPEPPAGLKRDARARHGHRVALLAAAAAVLAILIPVGVVALVQRDSTKTPPVSTQSPSGQTSQSAGPAPDVTGWRAETWRDVSLLVPDTWGYGDIHGCAKSPETPRVERPFGFHNLCLVKGWGYGVAFLNIGVKMNIDPIDPNAATQLVFVNGGAVAIVTPDQETLDRIVASIKVGQGDPNGCPTSTDVPALGEPSAPVGDLSRTPASLCLYSITVEKGAMQGLLEMSQQLSQGQTADLADALNRAPEGPGPDSKTCDSYSETQAILITSKVGNVWVHYDGCVRHGIDGIGPSTRRLTSDVMYWVLMPGWSGALNGVPHPNPLRQQ